MSSTRTNAESLLHLYDRPTEPVFMPKGVNNAIFEVPEDYLVDRYKPLGTNDLFNRLGGSGERIPVKRITLPDLSIPLQVERRAHFTLFLPLHRRCAGRLIEIFMGMRSLEDFISASVYCRDRLNPYLFIYALSVAILHRPDTKHLQIPSLCEVFPEKFMDGGVFSKAREESNIVPEGQRQPIEIPRDYTASDLDIEHRIAYFREDLGINLHHWHWHLVYPFDGPENIVRKDRRGEINFYMHQQIMARYNFERLCNNLARTKRLVNWREPIEEAYFPKLDSLVSSRVWPPRFANTKLSDINREMDQIRFDIQDMERWRDRIYAAIHSGAVLDSNGQTVELTEREGIDHLGNIIESSILSLNKNLYGDLHNLGHFIIGLCHDPDGRNLENYGVMADPTTTMRDPVFYRWHAFIDDICQEHKTTLPRYTTEQLDFPGVRITSAEIITQGQPKNRLSTFWQQSDVDFSRGLDFAPRGPVYARFTHLQHAPFNYKIQISNTGKNKTGTVRIFLAPKVDERGVPWLYRDQRNLFIELDKFVVNRGNNTVERNSSLSSVAVPFERTFRSLVNRPAEGSPDLEEFNYCGCGWPDHMLIPRGTEAGFPCTLFVMITNFTDDKVTQPSGTTGTACADAVSYCGLKDSLFPDKRPMGFPFDRPPRTGVDTIQQFLTPNMIIQDVAIQHTNRTVTPPAPPAQNRPTSSGNPGGLQSRPPQQSRPGGRN
uniref:Phenol oxidase 2 n=1 Tax=Rhodnius prolixus TaxID=13249 RepID=A0A1B2G381_RHOPR|nr:phenol oxidase 2 [Rhodnius prolixus]